LYQTPAFHLKSVNLPLRTSSCNSGLMLPIFIGPGKRPLFWPPRTGCSVGPQVLIKFIQSTPSAGSWDRSVGLVMGYGLDGLCSIPSSARFFSSPQCPGRLWGLTQPPVQWVLGALSPGVKHQECEANHSPPANAKDKKGGALPPLPYMSS
jgi:hypothetical protein